MPKYVTREETDIWGNDRTVTRSSATANDVGSAIGMGLGMLAAANKNAQYRMMVNTAEAAQKQIENREYDKALITANGMVSSSDKEFQTGGHFIKAMALAGLGRLDEAITEFTAVIEMARALDQLNTAAIAFVRRGRCFLLKNDLGAAMRDFTSFIRVEPNEDVGYFYQGSALAQLGDLDEALTNFSRAVSINPGDSENYRERARVYILRREPQKAIDDLSRSITLNSQDHIAYQLRGDQYAVIGDDPRALADYNRAIELAPEYVESYRGRAAVYQRMGNAERSAADAAIVAEDDRRKAEKWDYAETSWQALPKGKGLFGSSPVVFCAMTTDPPDQVPFATSETMNYDLAAAPTGGLVPRNTARSQQVLTAFLNKLVSDGWEVLGPGTYWFTRKLRRRSRGHVRRVRAD